MFQMILKMYYETVYNEERVCGQAYISIYIVVEISAPWSHFLCVVFFTEKEGEFEEELW